MRLPTHQRPPNKRPIQSTCFFGDLLSDGHQEFITSAITSSGTKVRSTKARLATNSCSGSSGPDPQLNVLAPTDISLPKSAKGKKVIHLVLVNNPSLQLPASKQLSSTTAASASVTTGVVPSTVPSAASSQVSMQVPDSLFLDDDIQAFDEDVTTDIAHIIAEYNDPVPTFDSGDIVGEEKVSFSTVPSTGHTSSNGSGSSGVVNFPSLDRGVVNVPAALPSDRPPGENESDFCDDIESYSTGEDSSSHHSKQLENMIQLSQFLCGWDQSRSYLLSYMGFKHQPLNYVSLPPRTSLPSTFLQVFIRRMRMAYSA